MSASYAEPKTTESRRMAEFPGVRILTPESCEFFKGLYSLLHVQLVGVGVHGAGDQPIAKQLLADGGIHDRGILSSNDLTINL